MRKNLVKRTKKINGRKILSFQKIKTPLSPSSSAAEGGPPESRAPEMLERNEMERKHFGIRK